MVQINAEASFDSHDRHDQRRPKKRSIRMRETAKVGDQNHAECRLEITQDKRMGVPDLPPTQDSSQHQDYSFRLGNNLHLALES